MSLEGDSRVKNKYPGYKARLEKMAEDRSGKREVHRA
jgi:hypothetical protein